MVNVGSQNLWGGIGNLGLVKLCGSGRVILLLLLPFFFLPASLCSPFSLHFLLFLLLSLLRLFVMYVRDDLTVISEKGGDRNGSKVS
jgi:hypothetical protein